MNTPWAMRMSWLDLCFLNWPVPAHQIARTLPSGMKVDTFHGQAWLSVVPFRMAGVAPRFTPDIPGLSAFPELNLRTYVVVNGIPGVWFYSLDAAQPQAVRLARQFFHLPYFDARMWLNREGNITRYASQRTHADAPAGEFAAAYRPTGPVFHAQPGTLEHWLTDRLALYSANGNRIYRGKVAHSPWPLQPAQAEININTLTGPHGIELHGQPLALYSERLDVKAWLLERAN